jgi:hypothetical protein
LNLEVSSLTRIQRYISFPHTDIAMNKILLLASAAAVVVDAERHRFRVGPTGIVSFAEGRAKMRAKMAAKTDNSSAMSTYTINAATNRVSTAAIDNNEVTVQPDQIQSAQLPASIRDNPTLYALVDADQDGTCTAYVAEVYTSGKCSVGNTEATDEFFDTKTYPDCESLKKCSNGTPNAAESIQILSAYKLLGFKNQNHFFSSSRNFCMLKFLMFTRYLKSSDLCTTSTCQGTIYLKGSTSFPNVAIFFKHLLFVATSGRK